MWVGLSLEVHSRDKISNSGIPSFSDWMGITANSLDGSYGTSTTINGIIARFASLCATAAKVDVKYCPFAGLSLQTASNHAGDDVFKRINAIMSALAENAYYFNPDSPTLSDVFTFSDMVTSLLNYLAIPENFPDLANGLARLETSIQRNATVSATDTNNKRSLIDDTHATKPAIAITVANQPTYDHLDGLYNPFIFPAVACLDNSFTGINNVSSFTDRIFSQVQQNSIAAFPGLSLATCLGWPDLSNFGPETMQQWPKSMPFNLTTKMLVVGTTYDPWTGPQGALDTYHWFGPRNAEYLVHMASGHHLDTDGNNCTANAVHQYLSSGTLSTCPTDLKERYQRTELFVSPTRAIRTTISSNISTSNKTGLRPLTRKRSDWDSA